MIPLKVNEQWSLISSRNEWSAYIFSSNACSLKCRMNARYSSVLETFQSRFALVVRQHAAECRLHKVFCWHRGNSTSIGSTQGSSREGIKTVACNPLRSEICIHLGARGALLLFLAPQAQKVLGPSAQRHSAGWTPEEHGAALHISPVASFIITHPALTHAVVQAWHLFKCRTCSAVGEEDGFCWCIVGKGRKNCMVIISYTNVSSFKGFFLRWLKHQKIRILWWALTHLVLTIFASGNTYE